MSSKNKYYEAFITHIDHNNNMSLVRYILAFGVLISHFNILCGAHIPWIVTNYDRVGGFFTLSGFLLASPLIKGLSFKDFAIKRLWRITPSYSFVIIVSAVFLCFFSSYSYKEYFISKGFWEYIGINLVYLNFLDPDLPGVFTNHAIPAVNGALWTMKVEWVLTLSLPFVLWIIARCKWNLRVTILLILFLSLIYRIWLHWLLVTTEKPIYEILGRQFAGQALYFYMGILIFTYYKDFRHRRWIFIIPSLILYVCFRYFVFIPLYYVILHPFVISFLVMGVALIPHDIAAIIDHGKNISYEIYLWHFPVFQVLADFSLVSSIGVGQTFALGIIAVLILSIITFKSVGRLYLIRKKRDGASPFFVKNIKT